MKRLVSCLLLSAACQVNVACADPAETYQLETRSFKQTEFQAIRLLTDGQTLELLVDTGAPTFYLEPRAASQLELVHDGQSQEIAPDGSAVTTQNIHHLTVSVADCQSACQHRFQRGLVRANRAMDILSLDGAVNPSQFAWQGCISFDLPEQALRFQKYTEQAPDCASPELSTPPDLVVTHQYVGEVTLPSGESATALFDTGMQKTMIHGPILKGLPLSTGLVHYLGYHDAGPVKTVEEIRLTVGDRDYTLQDVLISDSPLPRNVDVIIGLDVLATATILVGRDFPPRIHLTD